MEQNDEGKNICIYSCQNQDATAHGKHLKKKTKKTQEACST